MISPIDELIGGGISVKVPFTLIHSEPNLEIMNSPSPIRDTSRTLGKIEEHSKPSDDEPICHNKELFSCEKKEATTIAKTKEERMAEMDLIKHYDESKST